MYSSFRPGKEWLDTEGKRIEAHGGKLFYENDMYYWYGENKEYTDGDNGIWTWGVRAYSSKDLYNWKDEGQIIEPDVNREESPLHPTQRLDRPHIIYNETTKKYVCWIKTSGEKACFTICISNSLLGPYELIKDNFRPYGKKVGDFDLTVDRTSKRAFLFFDADHKEMVTCELTEDYLTVKEDYKVNFDNLLPPFVREAPAYMQRNESHYLLTSGLTNYVANPSEAAISHSHMGPYEVLGKLHPHDQSCSSYNSQISGIYKIPNKDLYIALADRWIPDYTVTKERYDVISRAIASRFDESVKITNQEKSMLKDSPIMGSVNTSLAEYVWLPIQWEGDKPYIEWLDEWRYEDYIK